MSRVICDLCGEDYIPEFIVKMTITPYNKGKVKIVQKWCYNCYDACFEVAT